MIVVMLMVAMPIYSLAVNDSTTKTNKTNQTSATTESIKEKQNQINEAQKEKENLKNNLTDAQKIKKELEAAKSDLSKYVSQLDNSLTDIQNNIEQLKAQIVVKEAEIERTQVELEEARTKENTQKDNMITRIRKMYEQGDGYYVEMFMKASNFGDFLNRADYVEKIMSFDRKMWKEYIADRQLVELCEAQLQVDMEVLDTAKANLETEEDNLENLIDQKNKDISNYENDISNKEAAIKEYKEMIAAQDAEIEALEAAIAEEKKALLASNGSLLKYDGGIFKFPLASYTRVSDDYGYRIHPILKVEQFHNGIDFAAPSGTAIYAAYDGKVVAATYSATMGNYIMIDHGDSLYTIYMHASALYVAKGDVVVRGETIAAVGTTGRSTGNHLHFSVRLNGSYVSPWGYISQ